MNDSDSPTKLPAADVSRVSLRAAVEKLAREQYLELFGEDPPPDDTEELSELRWDSFQAARFVHRVSAAFGSTVPLRTALKTLTLSGIVDSIVASCELP